MDHRGETNLDADRGAPGTSRVRHGGGRHRYEDRKGGPTYRPKVPNRDRDSDTGEWQLTDSGQWDSSQWDTGQWQRATDTGEWHLGDLAALDPESASTGHRPRHLRPDSFWDGIRLAGDDPRWVPTPASAPRSPVVAYPDPASAIPPAGSAPGAAKGRSDRGRMVHAVLHTVAWFVVPLLILFSRMLVRDETSTTDCVAGSACASEGAVATLMAALPRLGLALGVSIVVALVLARINHSWRPAGVGLAAALIGGGLTSAFFQLVSG